jgi:hypothetical protein
MKNDINTEKIIKFWIEGKEFETTNKSMTVQGILGLIGLGIDRYTLALKQRGGYYEYKESDTIEMVDGMRFQPFDFKTPTFNS